MRRSSPASDYLSTNALGRQLEHSGCRASFRLSYSRTCRLALLSTERGVVTSMLKNLPSVSPLAPPMQLKTAASSRAPIRFWLLGLALVVYVAACTGQRENKWGADAWEHQRAVLALTRQIWKPGNPTYASDLPSVRYSPYTVGWALFCKATGVDPYDALSAAAVVNTGLLVVGVWMLLGAFGEASSAAAVLVIMVTLWGGAPGYANSYALADLPWLAVNPSAFSFALILIAWALFYRQAMHGWRTPAFAATIGLSTVAMLDHGMTGAFGLTGFFVLALTARTDRRWPLLIAAFGLAGCVLLLCLAWPWFSFLKAIGNHQNAEYWFNRSILIMVLTQWCAPAILCSLFALPFRGRPLVRTCLAGGVVSVVAALVGAIVHSPVLARFPLPGMIYFHMALGVFAHESGIFRLSSWPARLRRLAAPLPTAAEAMVQCVLIVAVGYFFIPQLIAIATEPHLARPLLARLIHCRDLQEHNRRRFGHLLEKVGARDVVLSDPETSWLIPSFNGRIVAAIHYELFVPGQAERMNDVRRFFQSSCTKPERVDLLRRYHAQWIVLNERQLEASTFSTLLIDSAVVSRSEGLVLMSAPQWLAANSR